MRYDLHTEYYPRIFTVLDRLRVRALRSELTEAHGHFGTTQDVAKTLV